LLVTSGLRYLCRYQFRANIAVEKYSIELKRYFEAAESAAKELMEEDSELESSLDGAKHQQQQGDEHTSSSSAEEKRPTAGPSRPRIERDESDGVYQLTTIGSLPLKSPKRMVALQLANSNPAFR
jgi:hypothetical protein